MPADIGGVDPLPVVCRGDRGPRCRGAPAMAPGGSETAKSSMMPMPTLAAG